MTSFPSQRSSKPIPEFLKRPKSEQECQVTHELEGLSRDLERVHAYCNDKTKQQNKKQNNSPSILSEDPTFLAGPLLETTDLCPRVRISRRVGME
mmetsp:Transcript_21769/g.31254  ORF Transcript_21769/g.31254 Transcript_21769/m.31254 type:complete len:95 (-) Transcript_21769:121-405(-)